MTPTVKTESHTFSSFHVNDMYFKALQVESIHMQLYLIKQENAPPIDETRIIIRMQYITVIDSYMSCPCLLHYRLIGILKVSTLLRTLLITEIPISTNDFLIHDIESTH